MTGEERREKLIRILKESKVPMAGTRLAKELSVSRQVIVQDIALLRAKDLDIVSTSRGYVMNQQKSFSRILKVIHGEEDAEKEMCAIVDMGGWIKDVFVYHKVYGVIRAEMNIRSRRDVNAYMEEIKSGNSSLLMNITSGYHYHTVIADSEEILECIQEELRNMGFLAKLLEYEPVDFWKEEKYKE